MAASFTIMFTYLSFCLVLISILGVYNMNWTYNVFTPTGASAVYEIIENQAKKQNKLREYIEQKGCNIEQLLSAIKSAEKTTLSLENLTILRNERLDYIIKKSLKEWNLRKDHLKKPFKEVQNGALHAKAYLEYVLKEDKVQLDKFNKFCLKITPIIVYGSYVNDVNFRIKRKEILREYQLDNILLFATEFIIAFRIHMKYGEIISDQVYQSERLANAEMPDVICAIEYVATNLLFNTCEDNIEPVIEEESNARKMSYSGFALVKGERSPQKRTRKNAKLSDIEESLLRKD